jgi:hypothetical protein
MNPSDGLRPVRAACWSVFGVAYRKKILGTGSACARVGGASGADDIRAELAICRSTIASPSPYGRTWMVEGADGIVEGGDVADVRPQPSVAHPLDDVTQVGAIGLDHEVDRQAVRGPRQSAARPVPMTYAPNSRSAARRSRRRVLTGERG